VKCADIFNGKVGGTINLRLSDLVAVVVMVVVVVGGVRSEKSEDLLFGVRFLAQRCEFRNETEPRHNFNTKPIHTHYIFISNRKICSKHILRSEYVSGAAAT